MKSNEIRKRFLDFFASRGHKVVPSSSLVPANDPTLLFANAGMNQFKDVFLGREKRNYLRACSVQKCVRAGGKHNDLEQVGRTRRHHTFFEMLGNFSFGDYFKKDAVAFAWELLTKEFAISPDKLYVTIFEGANEIPRDAEAYDCWRAINVPADRIFEMGLKDNFWQMGETGPCGPCSEIHYDMGPEASELGHMDCKFPCPDDCGRYVEIWNLVFMQFNKDETGKMTPLPRPSIDTGAGLERLAAVLEGKISNFDTDLFRPLIHEAADLANVEYGANHDADVSLRIIADHARAATFLISDGVLPSNEGRGYVLRLIMRRALYHGQTLGLNEPFLFKMAGHVAEMMKDAYPELAQNEQHIAKAIKIEEERYAQTTGVGLKLLENVAVVVNLSNPSTVPVRAIGEVPYGKWTEWHTQHGGNTHALMETMANLSAVTTNATSRSAPPPGAAWVAGDELFKLHDTYGLRPDFVRDIVRNYGLDVDMEGYEAEMEKQRERARASWKAMEKSLASPAYFDLAKTHRTEFLGYDATEVTDCAVIKIFERGTSRSVPQTTPGAGPVEHEIVLDKTPFYGEAGGQVGDTGWLLVDGERVARVEGTYRPVTGLIAHYTKPVSRRGLCEGDKVTAVVDSERRDAIRRSHTATHLLHAALRSTLGTHVKQAGSLVSPDGLRFDFTHYGGTTEQDVQDVEDLVNDHILKDEEVSTKVMDRDAAVDAGAMALFGEKYGDQVRVVSVADGKFSKELCGGTHVRRTGNIGLFKITSESSVASGVRRIEAATGKNTLAYLRNLRDHMEQLQEIHRESEKKLRKQLESQRAREAARQADLLVRGVQKVAADSTSGNWKDDVAVSVGVDVEVKGVRVTAQRVGITDRAALRQMIDSLRPKLGSGVIVLGSADDGKVALIVGVTKDLTARLDAGKIVREAAKIIEGSGGGRKDLAEAGGKNPAKLDESLQAVPGIIEKML